MTDNKLWDAIIEPAMNVDLIHSNAERLRGVKLCYALENGAIVEVVEKSTNNIGTNYKKARQKLIDNVRKAMRGEVN